MKDRKNPPAPDDGEPFSSEALNEALRPMLEPLGLGLRTAGEADARAAALLPMVGSEDVSGMLVRPSMRAQPGEDRDYLPEEAVEWVFDVHLPGTVSATRVNEAFGDEWRERFGHVCLYGHSPDENSWTFVNTSDAPERFDALLVPIDLSPSSDDVSLSSLQHKAKGVASAAAELGGYAKPRIDVEMAVAQATRIAQVYDRYEEERVRIVLAADGDDLFDGEQIWDVMSCLGLRWGDMDLFHWENRDQSHGDDHLFSVETSSGEGYFLPEEIAAGETHVEDLVFSFGIPRNADPLITYSAMVAAARYAQQRLGGTLYGSEGEPLDVERETARVRACVDELTSAGFPPGEDRTLQLL